MTNNNKKIDDIVKTETENDEMDLRTYISNNPETDEEKPAGSMEKTAGISAGKPESAEGKPAGGLAPADHLENAAENNAVEAEYTEAIPVEDSEKDAETSEGRSENTMEDPGKRHRNGSSTKTASRKGRAGKTSPKTTASKTSERRKAVSRQSASGVKGRRKTSSLNTKSGRAGSGKVNSTPSEAVKTVPEIKEVFDNTKLGISQYFSGVYTSLRSSAKWIFFGILCGAVVGTIASIFAIAIRTGTQFRAAFPPLLYGLPIAGVLIVFAYHKLGFAKDGGTNTILEAIRDEEQVPIQMAPLIFIGTVLTHMFGGSAGREGAALQIGGSIGNGLGRILHFKSTDTKRVIMCGMSAAFSALFGTPLAAAILPIEISTVGIMYYSSLVPCVLSSLVAFYIAQAFGLKGEAYPLGDVIPMTLPSALLTVLLSVLCAFAAILFCTMMDKVGKLLHFMKNDYIRAAVGGVIVVIMTIAVGSQTYNGAGANIIELCFENKPSEIFALAFLLKMIFTAVTLGSGYKGGEIVPSLFIGATLGVKFGALIGFSPSLCAALGMCALFCGVTNCPVASLLICFEMFGFDAMPFFLLAVSFTYLFSGNFGLYHGQVIRYSKYEPGKVNARTHH